MTEVRTRGRAGKNPRKPKVRKAISKAARFEIFKRDRFTCQYCGAKAPDVVLHVDHVEPLSQGGSDDFLNLITACADCNGGKGARRLADMSVVERQRKQIEELQERREQLEMMLQWRDGLASLDEQKIDAVADLLTARTTAAPNRQGRAHIARWLKSYSLDEVLDATDVALSHHLKWKGDTCDLASWERAFAAIPKIAGSMRKNRDKPYIADLAYIQGIMRNRFGNQYSRWLEGLEHYHVEECVPIHMMREIAKVSDSEEEFFTQVEDLANQIADFDVQEP